MKLWAAVFACAAMLSFGTAYAVDLDNNGISGDETFPDPGTYGGVTDRDEVVVFPSSADTWQIASNPYWWHVGDTVYGTHTVSMGAVTHADITLYLTTNALTSGCGVNDIDFRIAGTTVGTFHVHAEDGLGPVMASFDFPAQTPPFELRFYETNQVIGGCGSIVMDASGRNEVNFGGSTPAVETTWGDIKGLFQ
jgi:hypothetical protein